MARLVQLAIVSKMGLRGFDLSASRAVFLLDWFVDDVAVDEADDLDGKADRR